MPAETLTPISYKIYFMNEQPLPDETNDNPCTGQNNLPILNNAQSAQGPFAPRKQSGEEEDNDEEPLLCQSNPCVSDGATDWIFCDLCDGSHHTACIGVTLEEAEKWKRCRAAAIK